MDWRIVHVPCLIFQFPTQITQSTTAAGLSFHINGYYNFITVQPKELGPVGLSIWLHQRPKQSSIILEEDNCICIHTRTESYVS